MKINDEKTLIILNSIKMDGLHQTFKSMTLREFVSFLESENLKEGITKIVHQDGLLMVKYK